MTAHHTIQFGNPTWRHGFTLVPNHVLEAADLTPGAKLTFTLLLMHGRKKDSAYPGQTRMARALGCTDKTLRGYLTELRSCGLVEVRRRGQGRTNLYILHPDRELRQVETTDQDQPELTAPDGSSVTGEVVREEETREEETDSAADKPQRIWSYYVEKVKPPRATEQVSPSNRGVLVKALREFDDNEALLMRAIDGFLVWRGKKPGDMRLSSIFKSHMNGRPLHDHIDFWIENAEGASSVSSLPSDVRAIVVQKIRDVQRGHDSDDTETVQRATEARNWLKDEHGIEPVVNAQGYPTFPSLGGG